jgi:hypothetical protein
MLHSALNGKSPVRGDTAQNESADRVLRTRIFVRARSDAAIRSAQDE